MRCIPAVADFWNRRWNLTVSNVLRACIYDPIMDGGPARGRGEGGGGHYQVHVVLGLRLGCGMSRLHPPCTRLPQAKSWVHISATYLLAPLLARV